MSSAKVDLCRLKLVPHHQNQRIVSSRNFPLVQMNWCLYQNKFGSCEHFVKFYKPSCVMFCVITLKFIATFKIFNSRFLMNPSMKYPNALVGIQTQYFSWYVHVSGNRRKKTLDITCSIIQFPSDINSNNPFFISFCRQLLHRYISWN